MGLSYERIQCIRNKFNEFIVPWPIPLKRLQNGVHLFVLIAEVNTIPAVEE